MGRGFIIFCQIRFLTLLPAAGFYYYFKTMTNTSTCECVPRTSEFGHCFELLEGRNNHLLSTLII